MNATLPNDFLFSIADDLLVIGHRCSEWLGMAPILEEDIAFSSIAQDKIGHALALYKILNSRGEKTPDELGFARSESDVKSCHFVEFPIGEFDYTLARHLLFDNAQYVLWDSLTQSSDIELAKLAVKIRGELKYHTFHANVLFKKLATGTEESKARMQSALNEAFPQSLGMFETLSKNLIELSLFIGEETWRTKWMEQIKQIVKSTELSLPTIDDPSSFYGGRRGYHTEFLAPLLVEMRSVFVIDPSAEW